MLINYGYEYEFLLKLVKRYIIDLWELRKVKLYGDGMVTDHSSDLLAGDRNSSAHVGGRVVNGGYAMAAV